MSNILLFDKRFGIFYTRKKDMMQKRDRVVQNKEVVHTIHGREAQCR